MTYHTIIIVGRLGRDPELRFSPTGQAICNLSIATDHSYTNKQGDKVSQVTWFRVTVFNTAAENANKYLSKGKMVLVEGRMNPGESGSPRVWTAQDGTQKASYEVNAQVVRYLSGRNEQGGTVQDDEFIDF